ncbi:glycosyltransferase [Butyrivibrio sp. YAB3001]|uniref:glycosyltransferase n=1 Tax=Butyrivibrio sp. YAB3001 TaxID=1520812 RepID=UPI0008F6473D|nr:glycosyltransferase [Butyrivibrio sp. YAB3001]SFC22622.1 Glycosyltransferase involved in cell wall bisynthesis [Butyrivibrio sp. YAB3001]
MNICLLNDSFPPVIDGVANVVMNYGSVFSKELGANVVVGTPRYPDASYDGYPYKVVPYPSFDTTDFVSGYRTGYPLSIREIAQMAAQKPDIIHTHCPATSTVMARILRKETGAPVIFTYHTKFDVDIARAVGEGFLKNETLKAMVNNIEACDDVWVVSEGAGENLRSLGYEGELRVMPNGVDFPKGRIDEDMVKKVVESYDLPEGIPVFLFVGRIMNYKGLPIIVDAMEILSKHGIDYRMIFVGGGADLEGLVATAAQKGIAHDVYANAMQDKSSGDEDVTIKDEFKHVDAVGEMTGKIIFVGPVHDREVLRAWNTRADLFLFPSVYDTNGIVVREAAACGLGSVLIKGSCAAEGITHGRNGYLIEENAESMAALLEDLSDKIPNMNEVGQHAMDEIYISWDQAARLAYDRYKEVHEMAVSGELGIRKHQSFEYLMNSAAVILDGTQKVFVDTPKNIYDGMRDNFMEFKDDFKSFTSDIKENMEDFRNDFNEGIDKIKDGISEGLANLSDNVDEIKDNISDSLGIDRDKK